MTFEWLLLLLPVAAASGWYAGRKNLKNSKLSSALPQGYFIGLNYLLNEQPDKAVDIFIQMLEVNSDTVETHLTLGSLFRRRGEVDRAIRIHQNLIARPQLNKSQRGQALLALGCDYLGAGVFDRAERLFTEVISLGEEVSTALKNLLDIYQQEKDWKQSILTAGKLQTLTKQSMREEIAHYYCELAEEARQHSRIDLVSQHLQRAISIDSNCVRASIIQGYIEQEAGNYKAAIKAYKQVKNQDPEFLSMVIPSMLICYEQLNDEHSLITYLQNCLNEFPRISIVLTLADCLQKWYGEEAAIEFITKQITINPSIRGLGRLIELQLKAARENEKQNLLVLQNLTNNLLESKPIYRCVQCGYDGKTLLWHCPSCKKWSRIKPIHGLEGD